MGFPSLTGSQGPTKTNNPMTTGAMTGSGFNASQTAGISPSQTGSGATDLGMHGSFALALGAIAAVFCLH